MAKTVTPGELGNAIAKELKVYSDDTTAKVNLASKQAAKELAEITRGTAPVRTGGFAARIDAKKLETRHGCDTWVWYVKPPDHRITHLVVHGHAKRDGGRTSGNSFLHDAWEIVKKKYEKAVEDAFR